MSDIEKSEKVYNALETLSLDFAAQSEEWKAISEFMVTAPMESFARLYDILQKA